jgi:hypothetical protein
VRSLFDEEVVEVDMPAELEDPVTMGKPGDTVDRLLTSLFAK